MGERNKLKINRRKLEEFEFQCMQNGLRLHFDSILLFKKKSFASALALSIIAAEEFGKGFGIDEILYQNNGRDFDDYDQEFMRALLSDHKLQQSWFIRVFGSFSSKRSPLMKNGQLQSIKNNAFYVGVKKGNHQIIRPFLVSKSQARSMISLLNNALINLSKRRIAENPSDVDVYDAILRRIRLVNKLKNVQKILSRGKAK